jgi:hypothetical protein
VKSLSPKRITPNICRNGNARQLVVVKRIIPDRDNAIGYSNARQLIAGKRQIPNRGNAVRNRYIR